MNKFNKQNIILPKNTLDKLVDLDKIDNFHLKLNKCVNWFKKDSFDSGILTIKRARIGTAKLDALKYKKSKTEDIEFNINPNFSKVPVNEILRSNFENATRLCSDIVKIDNLTSNWRLIVGLGNESVYETSITLHHIYGIPYIPASGIKGAIRNWVIDEKFDGNENLALENLEFKNIFGSQDNIGKVIFFDAYPINLENESIQPDIMNPHYSEYYDGNKPPADWQSPKPIFFLTVKDTNFEFIFGVKNTKDKGLLDLLTTTETGWLFRTLKEQGIGAKTAVGYGRMYEPKKIKPNYYGDKKINKGATLEGVITKIGKDERYNEVYYASIYVKKDDIRESIKVNRITNKLEMGAIIKVTITEVDKKGNFQQVGFIGEKK